tara:strand:+ start:31 stop:999 length:969 start_codon:yes stop_codon:yes gene_type:complete
MVGSADAGSGSGTLDTAKSTSVAGSVTFKGDYNANSNSPNLDTSPSCVKKGDQYVVSVGGAAFFTESLQAGDSLIAKQDDPTTLAHWIRIQSNLVTPIVASSCLSATGTKDATTFLRGDDTWAVVDTSFTASSTDTLTNKTFDQDGAGNSITNIANASIKAAAAIAYCKLDLAGNVVATTDLSATGTKDATTFLRGDDTWAVVDASPLTTKGDVYTFDTGNARLGVGSDGEVLKACSSAATGLVWGTGGGGATATHAYTNQSSTSYRGTGTSGTGIDVGVAIGTEASGAGEREIYIRKIDANNEGVFTVIHKNGAAVEVQIA